MVIRISNWIKMLCEEKDILIKCNCSLKVINKKNLTGLKMPMAVLKEFCNKIANQFVS